MIKNIARGAVAALVAGFAVVAPAAPASAASCSISSFTPRDVVIGLSPVKRTFDVRHNCGGGEFSGWELSIGGYDTMVFDGARSHVFFPPSSNADEGAEDVVAEAYGYSTADDTESYGVRIFYDGFRYKRRTTINSFNASPEPVRYGSPVTLRGKLLRANWTAERYEGMGGRSVAVQFRTETGAYGTVKTVVTDRYGWVNTRVTATRSGVWRLRYAGSGVSGAYSTGGDAVSVVR